jgi:hypothetical protein
MMVQATARVTLTVDIEVGSTWGDTCPIAQIHKQATEDALGILRRMKEPNRVAPYTIVGEPRVRAILVDKSSSQGERDG